MDNPPGHLEDEDGGPAEDEDGHDHDQHRDDGLHVRLGPIRAESQNKTFKTFCLKREQCGWWVAFRILVTAFNVVRRLRLWT